MLHILQQWLTFKSSKAKKIGGTLAFIGLAIGIFLALRSNPIDISTIKWEVCALVFFLVMPVVALINSLRFLVTADMVQNRISLGRSFIVTTYSTAANMLPLPGGFVVRVANLKGGENSYNKAVIATTYVSLLSAAITITLAASAYHFVQPGKTSLLVLTPALLLLLAIIYLSIPRIGLYPLMKLAGIEVASTVVDAIRIVLCFTVISETIGLLHSVILTASTVVGSAVSLVPSGLGVREGSAALLAAYIGFHPGTAFIALVINRILGLGFFMLAALYISVAFREEEE